MARAHRPLVRPAVAVAVGIAAVTGLAPGVAPGVPSRVGLVVVACAALGGRGALARMALVAWCLLGAEAAVRSRHVPAALDVSVGGERLVSVEGVVAHAPVGGSAGRWLLALRAMGEPWRPASGRIAIDRTAAVPRLGRGDVVRATGVLRAFPVARNPGGLDRREHYRRRGVVGRMSDPRLVRVAEGAASSPRRRLDALRDAIARRADATRSPVAAALVRALLLGDRRALDPAIADGFRRAGIVHLLAISGLHVALVGGAVFAAMRWLTASRVAAALVGLAVLATYAGLAGFAPPVVRAAVLAAGAMIAPALLRRADSWNSLAGAALVTLLARPADLFAPGFALSYAAVAGILLHAGRWDVGMRVGRRLPMRVRPFVRHVASSLAVSAAASVGTVPLVWAWFGAVHPWAPVATLLVGPLFVATLLAAFASVVPGVAVVAGPVFEGLGAALVAVASWCADWPAATIAVAAPGIASVIVAGAAFVAAARRPALVGWLPLVLIVGATLRSSDAGDHVATLLDVGHGLAGVATDARGGTWLYDAGSTDVPAVATRVVGPYLRATGRRRCRAAIVSHADHDHTSGIAALADAGWLARIVVDPAALGRAPLRAVHPRPAARRVLGDNDGSIAVVHERAGVRVLFTGDVEAAGIFGILRGLDGPVDVVVAPHHGGEAWNFPRLLDAARPRIVLVSARGEVRPATRAACDARAIPIASTAACGALTVRLVDGGFTVQGHVRGAWRFRRATRGCRAPSSCSRACSCPSRGSASPAP